MRRSPNLVIGNYNLDMVLYPVNLLPAWGEERTCGMRFLRPAGSAGYAALALRKLGMPVIAVGNIGDDFFGSLILNALNQVAVDTRYLQKTDAPTGVSVTMVNDRGDRAFVTHCGHLDELSMDDVIRDIHSIPEVSFCLLSGYFLLRSLGSSRAIDVLRASKARGGTTMLDTGHDPHGWESDTVESLHDILKEVDIFCPNYEEAAAISRESGIEQAARRLLELGPQTVIIKNGALGSLYASRSAGVVLETAIPTEVFDTTGAGDAFNAGVIYGFSHEWSPRRILRFASAVATLTISREDERAPSLQEVNRLLRGRGLA